MTIIAVNHAALLLEQGKDLVVEQRPVPEPKNDEILVRNHSIALNPVDWKQQSWGFGIETYPTILGSDIAGTVESTGSEQKDFKKGDRVIAWAGSRIIERLDGGAFQNWSIINPVTTSKLPDNIPFEQGAAIPLGLVTASTLLFDSVGVPLPQLESSATDGSGVVLIWGGSSSVGSNAIQLARRAGLKVLTTASPQHHEYLRSLGANAVFDYHSSTVVDDVIAAVTKAGDSVEYAVDTISLTESLQVVTAILNKTGVKSKKLGLVLGWPEGVQKPEGVEVVSTSARNIFNKTDIADWVFRDFLPTALENETFVASPHVKLLPGGLDGLQAGLDTLKKGVSGQKIVFTL
ncbi:chaperonin 10-like protein [Dactylonectria macrodidyma]|uniref:Chaperonin 10-like protein n=1 Tax=Dactylonectria macrodidyma TaxID=307937 RepID=A0A9P9FVC6_9HYPO|nr:chaperonin 10-like protein [Dactylonectria macrodidyma]